LLNSACINLKFQKPSTVTDIEKLFGSQ
jgi:hypothetical protein